VGPPNGHSGVKSGNTLSAKQGTRESKEKERTNFLSMIKEAFLASTAT
jgi:hypothetical protein